MYAGLTMGIYAGALLTLFVFSSAHAQTLEASRLGAPASLSGVWRWQAGDDVTWAQPGFDDSAWPVVQVPGSNLPVKEGFVWLRLHVTAPERSRNLAIGLGALAEASEIYWDGRHIGGLGTFHSSGMPRCDILLRPVAVRVPFEVIATNSKTVIALRLYRPHVHS